MSDSCDFYDSLAPLYHLIYRDWPASIQAQGQQLDSVIKEQWPDAGQVLDVSCGIGTQSLGLAAQGYQVTASDLSTAEVERAQVEAARRKLSIDFSVADMRDAFKHHQRQFDLVISCDNSVPHLLNDADISTAFASFYQCLEPGGGCIISVRDYASEDCSIQQLKPYGVRDDGERRWLIWQVWDPQPPLYQVSMYFTEDRGDSPCLSHVMRTLYYPIHIERLMTHLSDCGFENIQRHNDAFFQPLITAHKPQNF